MIWLTTALLFIVTFPLSIISMIYGWGIEPKSWAIIVLCALANCFLIIILETIKEKVS